MGEHITATEAARRYFISERTIRTWIQKGKLAAKKTKIDGLDQWQIDVEDIEQAITRKKAAIHTGILPEEITARFEQIEQQLTDIEQRLADIEKRLDTPPVPQPQEQPPAEVVAPVRAALASLKKLTPAPDEPMRLNQFADLHGIARNESERLWKIGFIAGKREGQGRRKGSVIINAVGQHDFWVQFRDHAEFIKCDTCPH